MSELALHVDEDGTQEWRLDGKLHREDGPACIYADGDQVWYLRGHLHRTDGPAVVWANSEHQEWWLYGELHRTDGPAIIDADGVEQWWVDGENLTQEEFELYRFHRWAVEGELV